MPNDQTTTEPPRVGDLWRGQHQGWRIVAVTRDQVFLADADGPTTGSFSLPTWREWMRRHQAIRIAANAG